jgi:hypothetical protein
LTRPLTEAERREAQEAAVRQQRLDEQARKRLEERLEHFKNEAKVRRTDT